jgi:hypothetical protein
MNALCRSFENTADADRAVRAALSAGVPREDIRMLMGAVLHDARNESRGGFATAIGSDERVGTFAGAGPRRNEPRGSFAGEGTSGGEGVFANADRDVVVTYSDGRELSRVAGHHTLKRLLVDAGLTDDVAESDVRALHRGRVLVLVVTAAVATEQAAELIDAAQ